MHPPCCHPPLCVQAGADVPTLAIKLPASSAHPKTAPGSAGEHPQGELERGSLDTMPWPPWEIKVTAADTFHGASTPGGIWGCWTAAGPLSSPVSPEGPPCITPKLMGAQAETSIAFASLGTDRVKTAATSVQRYILLSLFCRPLSY